MHFNIPIHVIYFSFKIHYLLREPAGKLPTRVGIKPPNLLPQYGSIKEQPNLMHLPLTGCLEERDLKVGSYEHCSGNTDKVEHL